MTVTVLVPTWTFVTFWMVDWTPAVGQVPYSEFQARMPVRMDWATAATQDRAVSAAQLIETNRIGPLPDTPLSAKVRSLAKPVPVTLDGPLGDGQPTRIVFASPEYGVSPGQAAVLYSGERVVGGGWIESTRD